MVAKNTRINSGRRMTTSAKKSQVPQYLGRPEVPGKLGISVKTLDRMVNSEAFPRPVRVSPGRVAWSVDVIDDHLSRLPGVTHSRSLHRLAPEKIADAIAQLGAPRIHHRGPHDLARPNRRRHRHGFLRATGRRCRCCRAAASTGSGTHRRCARRPAHRRGADTWARVPPTAAVEHGRVLVCGRSMHRHAAGWLA